MQTRQVSAAPTWPDASVNDAVALRAGETEIAICLGDGPNDGPGRLYVDGEAAVLDDGTSLSPAPGVDIWRSGSRYVVMDPVGNSVIATINSTWINVSVGLGRWPTEVRGLLGNADGKVNQIEGADGFVLTSPFPFADLYGRYADSWRVPRTDGLLSPCGRDGVERGAPGRTFYVADLETQDAERARAVCTEAGVRTGPLLEACTLDVVVIGDERAAKAFVDLPEPVAVGTAVMTALGHGWHGRPRPVAPGAARSGPRVLPALDLRPVALSSE